MMKLTFYNNVYRRTKLLNYKLEQKWIMYIWFTILRRVDVTILFSSKTYKLEYTIIETSSS